MINQNFGILAAIIALLGSINYAFNIYKGKTYPNRVTWVLWTIVPAISFAVEEVEHVHLEVGLLTLSEGVGPLLVLVTSFLNPKSYWHVSRFDLVCGAIAVLALILWLITGQGTIALSFSLLSGIFASVPTIVKAYRTPRSESPGDYLASTVAAVITLLIIRHWTFANYGFPMYLAIDSAILSLLILTPKRKSVNSIPQVPGSPKVGSTSILAVSQSTLQASSMQPDANDTIISQASDNIFLSASTNEHGPSMLGQPAWSSNPAQANSKTYLRVPIEYKGSVIAGEYIGVHDPGPGKGQPLRVQNGYLMGAIAATTPGVHPINVRARDSNGTWSEFAATELTVFAELQQS